MRSRITPRLLQAFALAVSATFGASGCVARVPDPKSALARYADAAARGDSDAIYNMLTPRAQRSLSRDEVKRIVADEHDELVDQGNAVTAPGVVVRSRARVRFADGEDATLVVDASGELRIASADALPAGARTPEQALEQLRRVLARRSYAGLLRVLTPATRSAIESDLKNLVLGLEHPEGLDVRVAGDAATVQIPGGHEVKLKREAGVWHVEDFD